MHAGDAAGRRRAAAARGHRRARVVAAADRRAGAAVALDVGARCGRRRDDRARAENGRRTAAAARARDRDGTVRRRRVADRVDRNRPGRTGPDAVRAHGEYGLHGGKAGADRGDRARARRERSAGWPARDGRARPVGRHVLARGRAVHARSASRRREPGGVGAAARSADGGCRTSRAGNAGDAGRMAGEHGATGRARRDRDVLRNRRVARRHARSLEGDGMTDTTNQNALRAPAEVEYAGELAALVRADAHPRPAQWKLSPWAVATYVLGGTLDDGTTIAPKYFGDRRLVEIAIATLATDRALLLLGLPGTAKSWLSEHLAAAISGESRLVVQGTAGTNEETLRYGWNYARLLAEGPSQNAIVPSPVLRGMREGRIVRVEELTRIPADVQDALISILSEKT